MFIEEEKYFILIKIKIELNEIVKKFNCLMYNYNIIVL